jgi:hypothetical protein
MPKYKQKIKKKKKTKAEKDKEIKKAIRIEKKINNIYRNISTNFLLF